MVIRRMRVRLREVRCVRLNVWHFFAAEAGATAGDAWNKALLLEKRRVSHAAGHLGEHTIADVAVRKWRRRI